MVTVVDNDDVCIKLADAYLTNGVRTPDGRMIGDYIVQNTIEKLQFYKKIFGIEKADKMYFEMYSDIEEWRDYYRSVFKSEPPAYSRGTFEPKKSLSTSVQHPRAVYGTAMWYKTVCTNAHEAFHMFYKKYCYGEDRIVWFDEGLAQFFSGDSEDKIKDEDSFILYFSHFLADYKPINNLNERIQGNNSVSDDFIFYREGVFNGYSASFLIIWYLYETKGMDYIIELMKDNKRIRELGEYVLEEAIEYYKDKYSMRSRENQ